MTETLEAAFHRVRDVIREWWPVNPDDSDETVIGWERITTTKAQRAEEPNLPDEYHVLILGSADGPAHRMAERLRAAGLLNLGAVSETVLDAAVETARDTFDATHGTSHFDCCHSSGELDDAVRAGVKRALASAPVAPATEYPAPREPRVWQEGDDASWNGYHVKVVAAPPNVAIALTARGDVISADPDALSALPTPGGAK